MYIQYIVYTIHKNQLYYIHFNEQSENEIHKTISFTLAAKRIKYLGINLIKEVQNIIKTREHC